jgi:hypothetical protein
MILLLLQFLGLTTLILFLLSVLGKVPSRFMFWLCVVVAMLYIVAGAVLASVPACVMAGYFLFNAYLVSTRSP